MTTPVTPGLSPKREFLKTQNAKTHRELVLNANFRFACEKALLAVVLGQPVVSKTEDAVANWHRVEGAAIAMQTLLNLGEEIKPAATKPDFNLNLNR